MQPGAVGESDSHVVLGDVAAGIVQARRAGGLRRHPECRCCSCRRSARARRSRHRVPALLLGAAGELLVDPDEFADVAAAVAEGLVVVAGDHPGLGAGPGSAAVVGPL